MSNGSFAEAILSDLGKIIDPDLHIDIVSLGLIYHIDTQEILDLKNSNGESLFFVDVEMTLTSPFCPHGVEIMNQIEEILMSNSRIEDCKINLVFDPPWGADKMTEEARLELGFDI